MIWVLDWGWLLVWEGLRLLNWICIVWTSLKLLNFLISLLKINICRSTKLILNMLLLLEILQLLLFEYCLFLFSSFFCFLLSCKPSCSPFITSSRSCLGPSIFHFWFSLATDTQSIKSIELLFVWTSNNFFDDWSLFFFRRFRRRWWLFNRCNNFCWFRRWRLFLWHLSFHNWDHLS